MNKAPKKVRSIKAGRLQVRMAISKKAVSPFESFTRGFTGSFKLAAHALLAIGQVGGRFIREEDRDSRFEHRPGA